MTRGVPDRPAPTARPEPGDPSSIVVRLAEGRDAEAIATLHAQAVTEGFLPTLGPTFLRSLHRRIVSSPHSFAAVAIRDHVVVGAVAATENVPALYREFLVRDGVRAGVAALPRLVRAVPHVIETLRHPTRHSHLPPAEILVVAVASDLRGKGIGRALVDRAVGELGARGVRAIRVVTTSGNEASLALYRAAGFRPVDTVQVHRGTDSIVLVRAGTDETGDEETGTDEETT